MTTNSIDQFIEILRESPEPDLRSSTVHSLIGFGIEAVPTLIESLLTDEHTPVRANCAYALGQIGPDALDAIPMLTEVLNYDTDLVCQRCVIALEEIGGETVIPTLAQMVNHQYILVCQLAADVLGRIGPSAAQAVPDLIQAIENRKILSSGVLALGMIGPSAIEAVPTIANLLREFLQERNTQGCDWATEALAKIGPSSGEAIPALIEALAPDICGWARFWAARALGKAGAAAANAVPALVEAINDDNHLARQEAAIALGKIHSNPQLSIPALQFTLDDAVITVRKSAAESLGKFGATARNAALALVNRLEIDETIVRKEIVKSLGLIGPPPNEVITALVSTFLNDDDTQVIIESIRSLGLIGGAAEEAIPALTDCLSDNLMGPHAAWALGKIRSNPNDTIPALIDALSNSDNPDIVSNAATAISQFGADALIGTHQLTQKIIDGDSLVKKAAIVAVGKIAASCLWARFNSENFYENLGEDYGLFTGTSLTSVLSDLLRDTNVDPLIRAKAAWALGCIGMCGGKGNVREALCIALGENDPTISPTAAWALAHQGIRFFGINEMLNENIDLSEISDPYIKMNTILLIGRSVTLEQPAIAFLEENLENSEASIRSLAALALGLIGPPVRGSVPKLISVLENETSSSVRSMVTLALGLIGGIGIEGQALALANALGDSDPSVIKYSEMTSHLLNTLNT